jgi:hypothetical protein
VSQTQIEGVSTSTLGLQPLDGDLTALSALSGINTLYYRSAADTWTAVTVQSPLTFTGGVLTAASGAGDVIKSGSPTNGQLARWTSTPNTIEGVDGTTLFQAADAELTAIAGLTSAANTMPYFTGSGTAAVTPLTSAARTVLDDATVDAMLTTMGGATLLSPTFSGTPMAPTPPAGDSSGRLATTAFVTGAMMSAPQGRLTLQSGTPVMTTSTLSATTMYYTPYVGRYVPIWDGTSTFVMTDIGGELSQTSTDTTKSPAAVVGSALYDFFVWNDGGVKRCTRGPIWVNNGQGTSARGTGVGTTELERLNGIWVNKNNIANGPAARRGTYVGTAQTDPWSITPTFMWKYGTSGTGTHYALLCVWNAYNRVLAATSVNEGTSSWTLGAGGGFRLVNSDPGNQILICQGLAENIVNVMAYAYGFVNTGSSTVYTGSGLNSQTVVTAHVMQSDVAVLAAAAATPMSEYVGTPSIGYNSFLYLEANGGPSAVTFQASGGMTLKFFA